MLGEYILAGFKVAMIILAMLIGFIALISAINALFATIFGLSFQQILGYVFYPLAWLIGIPLSDALNAGSIMATKLVANEFVAMIELKNSRQHDAARAGNFICVSGFFANFASIGIIAGAIKGLNEQQGNIVSRFGLRLVYGATLVSLLSASFAGLVLLTEARLACYLGGGAERLPGNVIGFKLKCTHTGWSTRITDLLRKA